MAEEVKTEVVSTHNDRDALAPFIISLIGSFGCIPVVSIVLGIVAMNLLKKNGEAHRNPWRVFNRISKPVAIVDIAVGAVVTVCSIVSIVLTIIAAINGEFDDTLKYFVY